MSMFLSAKRTPPATTRLLAPVTACLLCHRDGWCPKHGIVNDERFNGWCSKSSFAEQTKMLKAMERRASLERVQAVIDEATKEGWI